MQIHSTSANYYCVNCTNVDHIWLEKLLWPVEARDFCQAFFKPRTIWISQVHLHLSKTWCICYLNFSLFTGSAGNKLATSIVENYYCGTRVGGYLQGGSASEPAIAGSVVNATVCFYHSSSYPCYWPLEIKIRHCPGFLLYYLPQVVYCQLKYCGQQ